MFDDRRGKAWRSTGWALVGLVTLAALGGCQSARRRGAWHTAAKRSEPVASHGRVVVETPALLPPGLARGAMMPIATVEASRPVMQPTAAAPSAPEYRLARTDSRERPVTPASNAAAASQVPGRESREIAVRATPDAVEALSPPVAAPNGEGSQRPRNPGQGEELEPPRPNRATRGQPRADSGPNVGGSEVERLTPPARARAREKPPLFKELSPPN